MKEEYPLEDYIMDVEDAAAMLDICVQWVRIKARTGSIPSLKLGRRWRFCRQELKDHIRTMTVRVIEKNTTNDEKVTHEPNKGNADTGSLFC